MLQQKSEEIDSALAKIADLWRKRAIEIEEGIKQEQAILASDEAKTDRSENAVYQIAIDNFSRLQVSKRDIDNKIDAYNNYNIEYIPSEFITMGATVQLKLLSENGHAPSISRTTRYIKLVPEDLGAAKIGAVSESSPVGRALRGKCKGDVFKVRTRKGEIEYMIEEVY